MYRTILILPLILIADAYAFAQQKPSEPVQQALAAARLHVKDTSYLRYLHAAAGTATKENDMYGMAMACQTIGNYFFSRNADSCIAYNQLAFQLFKNAGDEKRAAICLHSIGFAYDEGKHQPNNALQYIEQSVPIHRNLNDTLELANMYKYMGMLKGKLNRFAEAKQDVNLAIQYYAAKEYKPGIAVSHFDMSQVFVAESNTDSAIAYLSLAKQYWLVNNNAGRIFGLNNYFFETYFKAGMSADATRVLQENEALLAKETIYYTDRLQFYNNSIALYSKVNNINKKQSYTLQYQSLKDSLAGQGIKVD